MSQDYFLALHSSHVFFGNTPESVHVEVLVYSRTLSKDSRNIILLKE